MSKLDTEPQIFTNYCLALDNGQGFLDTCSPDEDWMCFYRQACLTEEQIDDVKRQPWFKNIRRSVWVDGIEEREEELRVIVKDQTE